MTFYGSRVLRFLGSAVLRFCGSEVPGSTKFQVLVLRKQNRRTSTRNQEVGTPEPRNLEPGTLNIQILRVESVLFNELATRLDLIAHERREHQVGLGVVLGPHLQERAL